MNLGGPLRPFFLPQAMAAAAVRPASPAPALRNGLVTPPRFAPGEPRPGLPLPPVTSLPTSMNDQVANQIVGIWKGAFSDAALLPVIGLPSNNKGVMTMTHTMQMPGMPPPPPMTINGLPTNSPLGNNALFSSEVSQGKWLNLYEIMLPDIPGSGGQPSLCQKYVNALQRGGIDVAGNHYHWTGARMLGQFPLAIHSQAIGMDPVEFSNKQIGALRYALGMR